MPELNRSRLAALIRSTWQKSLDAVLDVGRLLLEAKKRLAHGEFTAMIVEDLPFGDRAAERLMAVASNPVLSNPTHASLLPPSWMTLYELSRLPLDTLEKAISEGSITPETERHEVARLAGRMGTPITSHTSGFPCPGCGGDVVAIDWSNARMDQFIRTQVHECRGECKKLWLTGTLIVGEYHKRSLPQGSARAKAATAGTFDNGHLALTEATG